MARLGEVIEPREFMTRSHQWYRRIGAHRYRFRYSEKPNGSVDIVCHRATGRPMWTEVHNLKLGPNDGAR